jgi:hypothetical protein
LHERHPSRPLTITRSRDRTVGPALAAGDASWPSGGQNISDTHFNAAETKLNVSNVGNLAVKWTYTTHGDVSAIPAVVDGAVYFPDLGGYLNKVDAATGAGIWSRPISDYNGVPSSVSRASPAVVGNTVYLGDQNGGHLLAVNATTGAPLWTTQVDSGPFPILTAGPLVPTTAAFRAATRRRCLEHHAGDRPGEQHALHHDGQQLHLPAIGQGLRGGGRQPVGLSVAGSKTFHAFSLNGR